MNKNLFIFFILLTLSTASFGQHEMTLFHMNNVFQSTYVNPTAVPEQKVSIGLPAISSLYSNVYFSPFVAKDIHVVKTSDTSYQVNLDKAIAKMAKTNNYLNTSTAIDLLSFRVKVRNVYVSLNATNITNIRFNFPRDLFSLAWYGNAQYIGSSVDLNNLGINAMQYNEYALGLTRAKDGGKWRYGVRLKFLQGLNDFYTARSSGTVSIDNAFYQHTLSANMQAYSASVIPYDSKNINLLNSIENFSNKGLGADLGASYTPNKRWSFTGALNNIGFINWKTNAQSYAINGTYQFQGISLDSLVNKGDVALNDYVDTLSKRFHLDQKKISHYRTMLTPSVYLSAAYSLGRNTKIALTGYGEFYHGLRPAGSVAFIQRAGRILNFVISYNVRKNSYNNMGFGLMLKPGPFQIYVVGDNMLVLNPFNTNNLSVRTGVNLVFGRTRLPERQTHED
ncbi:MAG TPA: DUF5723 family protein [Cytophagaceae bacterium]|nr:DUF5723 family protein [Cytophagaceae bacterium]